MASIFLRGDRWVAKLKLWKAELGGGAFVWVQRALPRGLDKSAAGAVAAEMERVSAAVGRGVNVGDVRDLLRFVLGLAGVSVAGEVAGPGTLAFAREYVAGKSLTPKSTAKYAAYLKRMEAFLKCEDRAVDGWVIGQWRGFYDGLRGSVSVVTANQHLAFWRSVFARAGKLGLVQGNLPGALELRGGESVGKDVISRGDMVRLVRYLRGEYAWSLLEGDREVAVRWRAWLGLVWLGWHTGHRIADLLLVEGSGFVLVAGVGWVLRFRPGKKRGVGGREVSLPVPGYVRGLCGVGFGALGGKKGARNWNGKLSAEFVDLLVRAGVEVVWGKRPGGMRSVSSKSFHSFRHGMASRLAAAGVDPEVARLVTDHDSPVVHRGYVHTEVAAVAGALRRARRC